MIRRRALALLLLVAPAWATEPGHLVLGSFAERDNAQRWAHHVSRLLERPISVVPAPPPGLHRYRVASSALSAADFAQLARVAEARGLDYWRLPVAAQPMAQVATPVAVSTAPVGRIAAQDLARSNHRAAQADERRMDFDLGVQSRAYADSGLAGQSRFQPSLSARMELFRSWDQGRQSLTFVPFLRLDGEDGRRTHLDVRELYWARIGDDWELRLGVQQVFWGVTEFKHLVDIVNQTDLVENIDGEDKLGQPMAHLSLVRDWGILDVMLMSGFRERTFPGTDGRLRFALPVDHSASFESGAGRRRVDAAVRWSHAAGPVEWGIYHFSGTSRAPQLLPRVASDGTARLFPHYPVIDQTGLDAQAVLGDWALKLEAISNSGFGDRYTAFNAGFERTLVGVLGSRADLGLVVEYMFDDRDATAFDTLFEHDVAVGTRWHLNDAADTQALVGLIWDVDTDEYVVSVEGSRRLGNTWTLAVEGRVFGGAAQPDPDALLESLFDADNRSASLQRDDFIQLELTRYF